MEKFNLTTAINYVNGPPHIGHVLELVIGDVVSKYYQINNYKTHFLTGADEHGQKIKNKASDLGITPKKLCNKNVKQFKKISEKLGIGYDSFVRTTDSNHTEFVYEFYNLCKQNGDIYLGKYEGWYNPREERFVTELEAKSNNYIDPISKTPLSKIEEPSYFFRLSKYTNIIKNYLINNPDFIIPSTKTKDILNRLEDGLTDLSISRTSIKWGISVPDDKDHVFYVWFDALISYITNESWPADLHIIGKDILWFHTVIWLSMLISADYNIPKHIFVHEFVNDKNGNKMSKSIGNVVSPNFLISKYPVCAIRYYLASNVNGSDICFDDSHLVKSNNELLQTYGNLVNRVFGLFHKYCDSRIGYYCADELFDISDTVNELNTLMSKVKIGDYIKTIMKHIRTLNSYVNDTHIWTIGKSTDKLIDNRSVIDMNNTVGTLMEGIYIVSHFLWPVIPDETNNVFGYLNTNKTTLSELTWSNLEPQTLNKCDTILFKNISY